nr:hypothetical protein Iba_chr10aCG5420 [Ipomoea batatas]
MRVKMTRKMNEKNKENKTKKVKEDKKQKEEDKKEKEGLDVMLPPPHLYPPEKIRACTSDVVSEQKMHQEEGITVASRLLRFHRVSSRRSLSPERYPNSGIAVPDWECLDRSSSELLATSIPQKSPSRLRNCWIEDEEEWNRDSDDDCREWNGGFDLQAGGLD